MQKLNVTARDKHELVAFCRGLGSNALLRGYVGNDNKKQNLYVVMGRYLRVVDQWDSRSLRRGDVNVLDPL